MLSSFIQLRRYTIYETEAFHKTERFIEEWPSYSRKDINSSSDVLLTGNKELDNAVLEYNTASFKLTPVNTKKSVSKLINDEKETSKQESLPVEKVVKDMTSEEEDMQTVYPKDTDPTVYAKEKEQEEGEEEQEEEEEAIVTTKPTTLPPSRERITRYRGVLFRRNSLRNRTSEERHSERGTIYRYSSSRRWRQIERERQANRTAEVLRRRREARERREYRYSTRRKGLPYSKEKWKTVIKKRPKLDSYASVGSQQFKKDAVKHILNYQERGICGEGLCRKFVGGVEVPYNYSTECRSVCPLRCREFLPRERGRNAHHDRFVGFDWRDNAQIEPLSVHRRLCGAVGRVCVVPCVDCV